MFPLFQSVIIKFLLLWLLFSCTGARQPLSCKENRDLGSLHAKLGSKKRQLPHTAIKISPHVGDGDFQFPVTFGLAGVGTREPLLQTERRGCFSLVQGNNSLTCINSVS